MNWNVSANIAFGALIGVIVAAATIAVFQTDSARFDLDTFAKLAAVLVAPLTLGIVLGTLVLARETREMWIQNRAPHVIVTIEPLTQLLGFVELVVENVGGGPAFDVVAHFDPELQVTDPPQRRGKVSDTAILRPPTLKPRQRIATFLAGYFQVAPRRTIVTCTCTDASGALHTFVNAVDLDSYLGQSRLGEDPFTHISDELEKLRKAVEEISTGRSRLEVNVHDDANRASESEKRAAEMRAFTRKFQGLAADEDPIV